MTTIVYDHKNKQIACDSRSTNGWMITSDDCVKYKKHNEVTWFIAGNFGEFDIFISDFEPLKNAKENIDNSVVFVSDGDVSIGAVDNGVYRSGIRDCNAAIGSGGDWALAALDFGKTAKEAVEYAISKDFASGGKVHVYDIEKGEFV